MIVLVDDLDPQTVSEKTNKPKTISARLGQALVNRWVDHRKRKADKIALHQLMQLDDALLKDIGISRNELVYIRDGTLTFDALVKQTILSNRDNACSTTSLRK